MNNMDTNPVYKTGDDQVYLSLLPDERDRTACSAPEPPPPRPSDPQEGCYEVLPGDFGEPPHNGKRATRSSVQTPEQPKGMTFQKNEGNIKAKRKRIFIIATVTGLCVTVIAITLLAVYVRMPVSDPDVTVGGDSKNLQHPVAGKVC